MIRSAGAPITAFSWGYWGWGTATSQFVQAADVVEAWRGFEPPFFVDIRIRRSVRAPGFTGAAFEATVGPDRHYWMRKLGNRAVLEGKTGIEIDEPAAAEELLDQVLTCGARSQRVLFFCSCEFPGLEHAGGCHRTAVARLLLDAAAKRDLRLQVVEWPGGEPPTTDLILDLPRDVVRTVARGSASIVVGNSMRLEQAACIPWYAVASIRAPGSDLPLSRVLTGPAKFSARRGWWLPRLDDVDPQAPATDLQRRVQQERAAHGFAPRVSQHL